MLALLLASAAGAGLLAWHMQRRAPLPLRLSFARLLPEPPVSEAPERRFALTLPLRSAGFWLRMLAVALAIAALMLDLDRRAGAGDQGIGLRIVLDVTHSMGLPEGDGTRLDAAQSVAEAALARLPAAAGSAPTCAEAVIVGASAGAPGPVQDLARATVLPQGGEVSVLVAAAAAPVADCPLTHVLVLTDALRPATDWPEATPLLLWHQIGEPLPNSGLRGVTFAPPGLGRARAVLRIEVASHGDTAPPGAWLDGPGGRVPVPLDASADRDGLWLGEVAVAAGGPHLAGLDGGGAYGGDDRMAFDLPQVAGLALDWRLGDLPAPRGTTGGPGALLVADLGGLAPQDLDRPLLATYPGWPGAAQGGRIGAFVQDRALLSAINLDVFERLAPRPLQGALPPGFVPVLTDAAGAVHVARRSDPPGLIVPAPLRDGGETEALSLSLFFAALADLAGRGQVTPAVEWRDAEGGTITDAARESDTARRLEPPPAPDLIAPRAMPAPEVPVWPLLALLALALLLAERALTLWRGLRHAV
ncbi:MAG: hypothetical protein ACT4OK_15465 [Gemmobacter sp.]